MGRIDSLRIACRYPFKVAPDFPRHSDIKHILKLVESYLNKQYDYMKRQNDISYVPTTISTC